MFELEAEIHAWRLELLSDDSVPPSSVDELEDHLREEMAGLSELSLSPAETFLVAKARLGTIESLMEEFAVADPGRKWRRRIMLMVTGYALFWVQLWLFPVFSFVMGVFAVWRFGLPLLFVVPLFAVLAGWILPGGLAVQLCRGRAQRMSAWLERPRGWIASFSLASLTALPFLLLPPLATPDAGAMRLFLGELGVDGVAASEALFWYGRTHACLRVTTFLICALVFVLVLKTRRDELRETA